MPRKARVVVPGRPHHITQRGNNRQPVFFSQGDYHVYLAMLREQAEQFGLKIEAYCLMPNHVHLVGTPQDEQSLAKSVGSTHQKFAQFINRHQKRSGHLWQDRPFSCVLDEPHFWNAVGYVERNPVRASIVKDATEYTWSSAAGHCGQGDYSRLLDLSRWNDILGGRDWPGRLRDPDEQAVLAALRSSTMTGRPCGDKKFIEKLEQMLGVKLTSSPIGRPKAIRQITGKKPGTVTCYK